MAADDVRRGRVLRPDHAAAHPRPEAALADRARRRAARSTVSPEHRSGTIPISSGRLQLLLMLAGLGCCLAMSMPQVHIVAYAGDLGYGLTHGARMLSVMLGIGVVSRLASGSTATASAACARCCSAPRSTA